MTATTISQVSAQPSDPEWSKVYRDTTDVPWYMPDISSRVTPETRKMLVEYSGVRDADILQHVHEIRDKAWMIRSYPCTGLGLWLDPMIPKCPVYGEIIERLRHGDTFLDIGCFLGHGLRRLVADGAAVDNLYAVDLVNHWDLGYELFRDRNKFHVPFVEGDILNADGLLASLKRKMDIVSIIHVLHQWDWDGQVVALKQLVKLVTSKALVVGYQVGCVGVRQKPVTDLAQSPCYWHDPNSVKAMWDQVGAETGTSWSVTAKHRTWEEVGWNPEHVKYLGDDARVIEWLARRVR